MVLTLDRDVTVAACSDRPRNLYFAMDDSKTSDRFLSMAMAAQTQGADINPNCNNECVTLWEGMTVTKCGEGSIYK